MTRIRSVWREAWTTLPEAVHPALSQRDGDGWFPSNRTIRSLFPTAFGTDLPSELALPAKLRGYVHIRGDKTIDKLEPQMKEAFAAAVHDVYAYLKGKTDTLSVSISLTLLVDELEASLYEEYMDRLPAPLTLLTPQQQQELFDTHFQEFAREFPIALEFSEADIPYEEMEIIQTVRTSIIWSERAFYILIAFMVLLIALIAITERDVRKTSRALGITMLVYGAIEYIGILTSKGAPLTYIPDIPDALRPVLSAIINDSVRPLEMLSLGVLVAGVALVIVSFVYKKNQAEE